MSIHQHIDGIGEGYCSCGAERCSLPGCDMGCVHPGGWVDIDELLALRRPSAALYLDSLCLCRFTAEGWVNTLCPRHRGDDEQ